MDNGQWTMEALEKQEAYVLDVQTTIDEEREEASHQQAVAIARRMLRQMDDATISEMTGLPLDVVRELHEAEQKCMNTHEETV
jgi:hypothetical protein